MRRISHKVIAWYLFLGGVLFLPFFRDSFYMPKNLLAGLFVIYLIRSYKFESAVFPSPFLKLSLALLIWTAAGLFVNNSPRFIFTGFMVLSAALIIMNFFAGYSDSDSVLLKRRIIHALLLSLIFISVYGIIQYFGIGLFDKFQGTPLPYSTLGHRNYLADFIILILPFTIAGVLMKKPICIITVSSAVLALVFASSFRSIIALPVMLTVYALLSPEKSRIKKYLTRTIPILVIAGFFIIFAHRENIIERNLSLRLFRWRVSADILKDYPLTGVGLGRFSYLYPGYQKRFLQQDTEGKLSRFAASPEKANNEYIHILTETGVVGFLILICLIIKIWRRIMAQKTDEFSRASLAGFSGIMVSAFFGFPFHRPEILFVLAVILGISASRSYNEYKGPYNTRKLSVLFKGLAACLISVHLILLVVSQILHNSAENIFSAGNYSRAAEISGIVSNFSYLPGRILFLKGRAEFRLQNYSEAIESYNKAEYTYKNPALYYNRGLAYMLKGLRGPAVEDFNRTIAILPFHRRAADALVFMNDISYEKMLRDIDLK